MEKYLIFKHNNDEVTYEKFDKEIVAINLKTGSYYSLLGSGFTIWMLIGENIDIGTVKDLFKKKFHKEIGIEDDIDDFIKKLKTEKLIVQDSSVDKNIREPNLNSEIFNSIYTKPVLEKYTDQQELLRLDPIHEVNDLGWPGKK